MSTLVLPAKPDIERLVLGAIQMNGERFPAIRQSIDRDVFTCEKHKVLWDAFERLYADGKAIDRVTTYHATKELAPTLWSLSELAALDDDLPMHPAIDGYLDLLGDIAARRTAILGMDDLMRSLAEGGDTRAGLAKAERIIREFQDAGARSHLATVGGIVEAAGGIDRVMRPAEFTPATRLPWPSVCRVFAGLAPGQLTILAGRPGDGKTTFAIQALHHAATLGKPVAVFSLEMGGLEIARRLACLLAQVPLQKFMRGYAARDEERAIVRELGELAHLPLTIDDSNTCTVGGIRRALLHAKQTPQIVAVDYLQLLSTPGPARQRYEALGELTRGLKILAREMEVSVLCLSQLTRGNEHEKRLPELRDLRESGSIEQDADNVLMLHHVRQGEQRGADHPAKVLIRKQRLGPVGEVTLKWNTRVAAFEEPGANDWGADE